MKHVLALVFVWPVKVAARRFLSRDFSFIMLCTYRSQNKPLFFFSVSAAPFTSAPKTLYQHDSFLELYFTFLLSFLPKSISLCSKVLFPSDKQAVAAKLLYSMMLRSFDKVVLFFQREAVKS